MKGAEPKRAPPREEPKTNPNDKDAKHSARHTATSRTPAQHCSLYSCIGPDLIDADWAHLWAPLLHIESSRGTSKVPIRSNRVQIL